MLWIILGNWGVVWFVVIFYGLYEVKEVLDESFVKVGECFVFVDILVSSVCEVVFIENFEWIEDVDLFEGFILFYLFVGYGYDFDVLLLVGDFVMDEIGIGFVYIVFGYGFDDFELGFCYGLEVLFMVDEDGCYLEYVFLFVGL